MAQQSLNGAGATFPAPLYQKWFQELAASGGPRVNYQAVGSGAGVRQMIAGTSDFGASDKPLSDAKRSKIKRGVVQIPMTGGTIAVGYNKPGCDLKLTQKQVAEIFLGKITDYNQVGCLPARSPSRTALMVLAPPSPSLTRLPPGAPTSSQTLASASPSTGQWVQAAKATAVLPV